MSEACGMSTGSGETSLVSQAPAKMLMRWLCRYLMRNQTIISNHFYLDFTVESDMNDAIPLFIIHISLPIKLMILVVQMASVILYLFQPVF